MKFTALFRGHQHNGGVRVAEGRVACVGGDDKGCTKEAV